MSSVDLSQTVVDVMDAGVTVTFTGLALDEDVGFMPDTRILISHHFKGGSSSWDMTNTSADRSRGVLTTDLLFRQSAPDIDDLGVHDIYIGSPVDANGNGLAGWTWQKQIFVATRPVCGKQPALAATADGLFVSWMATPDMLGVQEYEVEFSSADVARTYSTSSGLRFRPDDLPGGHLHCSCSGAQPARLGTMEHINVRYLSPSTSADREGSHHYWHPGGGTYRHFGHLGHGTYPTLIHRRPRLVARRVNPSSGARSNIDGHQYRPYSAHCRVRIADLRCRCRLGLPAVGQER